MSSLQISFDRFRPKVCAFYAGRAWYSGIPSGNKLGWVMFSQVLTDISNVVKCYQQNDPTSEAFSDILDSDGGVIQIPEAGEIVGLAPLGPLLLVMASNGVWQIWGGNQGFSASNYIVEKITNLGCLFQKSIVVAEDRVFYWGTSSIYMLEVDSEGRARVTDISEQKIKEFYQSIPSINKLYVEGKYNSSEKVIYWAYNSNSNVDTSTGIYKKNRVLCYNLQLSAFYTFTIKAGNYPIITSFATTKETIESANEFTVVVGTDEVVVGSDEVVADIPIVNGALKQIKWLTFIPDVAFSNYTCTWSDTLRTYANEWRTFDVNNVGFTIDSYLVTGYNVGGTGPTTSKTAKYVHVFAKRTETGFDGNVQPETESSILMQTKWDFTDNSNPGKWSDEVQVYRPQRPFFVNPFAAYDDGYPLVITKNKVRGRGKALQVQYRAEPGKQMHLMGWSIGFVNNTSV